MKALAATVAFLSLSFVQPLLAEPFRLIVTDLETPLVPNSIMDLADQLGYFAREGVDVELVRVQQTPSALAALQSGEGEMANVGTDTLLQLVAAGADNLRAVASPNKSLPFLIGAKDEIATPEAMEGRSFAIGRIGSLDHLLSMNVLTFLGVDTDKLALVSLGQPSVRAQALLAGQVDATTMSIGVWTALPDREGIHIVVDQDRYYQAAPVVTKVNIVSTNTLVERGDDVKGVLAALVKISRDFADAPNRWVESMTDARPDVEPDSLKKLAETYSRSWSINGGLQKDELEYTANWIYQGPDFKDARRVALDEWVDFAPLDAVLSELGAEDAFDRVSR